MQIKKRTPRTELEYDVILSKMGEILTEIAQTLNAQDYWVDRVMTQYARLSARVIFSENEVDFDLIDPTDSSNVIRAKFERYLDSEQIAVIEQALEAMISADLPTDLALAPEAPVGDPKKQ